MHVYVSEFCLKYIFDFFYPLLDIQEFYEVAIQEKQNESAESIKPAEPCSPANKATPETRSSKVRMNIFIFSLICSFLAELTIYAYADYSHVQWWVFEMCL